jgi:hypothetical protein
MIGFAFADKGSAIRAPIPALALKVINPRRQIQPYNGISRAMPLRRLPRGESVKFGSGRHGGSQYDRKHQDDRPAEALYFAASFGARFCVAGSA